MRKLVAHIDIGLASKGQFVAQQPAKGPGCPHKAQCTSEWAQEHVPAHEHIHIHTHIVSHY